MKARRAAACVLAAALAGCDASPAAAPPASAAPPEDPRVAEARDLLRRAESAPLPTPLPPPSPIPRGWKPGPAPDYKAEEVEAVRMLEQAVAASPGQPAGHALLARALEAHAVRRHDREAARRPSKRAAETAPPDQGIDDSPARVARAYRAAAEADPGSTESLEALIRFGLRVRELDSVDWAHQELIRRARERATAGPVARYADFLRDEKKDTAAAVEQYRNALIWAPDDAAVRAKLAEIHLGLARERLDRQEFAAAEVQVREAAKYVSDRTSAQGRTLEALQKRLAEIRR